MYWCLLPPSGNYFLFKKIIIIIDASKVLDPNRNWTPDDGTQSDSGTGTAPYELGIDLITLYSVGVMSY